MAAPLKRLRALVDLLGDPYFDDGEGRVLYCGEAAELLRRLPDRCVDAVVTDPPWGVDLQPHYGKTKAIRNDKRRDAKSLWWSCTPHCWRALRDDAAAIFFAGVTEPWAKDVLAEWFDVKGAIAWVKNGPALGWFLKTQFELAYYLHKGKPPRPETPLPNVWRFPRVRGQVHSCEKPTALLAEAMGFCGGELFLDPFAGTASTLRAARRLGVACLAIELEEEHCANAVARFRSPKHA